MLFLVNTMTKRRLHANAVIRLTEGGGVRNLMLIAQEESEQMLIALFLRLN